LRGILLKDEGANGGLRTERCERTTLIALMKMAGRYKHLWAQNSCWVPSLIVLVDLECGYSRSGKARLNFVRFFSTIRVRTPFLYGLDYRRERRVGNLCFFRNFWKELLLIDVDFV
jgi:hypothetical protein